MSIAFHASGRTSSGSGAELDGEVERDALHDDRERKDGERLPELWSGEAVDACAARLDRARELRETGGTRPAAVEADECVASVECEPRAVKELLDREPLGEHVRGLAHLERSFGRGPLIRAGAHELEAALGQLDRGARRCQRVCDRFRNRLELTELGAQSLSKLRETAERTQMARGERAGGLLCDRLDIGTRRAFAADRDRGNAVGTSAFENLAGVALRAAVAQEHEPVGRCRPRAPFSAVGGRHREGVDAGQPQEVRAEIRGVPARPGPHDEDAAPGEPFGTGCRCLPGRRRGGADPRAAAPSSSPSRSSSSS